MGEEKIFSKFTEFPALLWAMNMMYEKILLPGEKQPFQPKGIWKDYEGEVQERSGTHPSRLSTSGQTWALALNEASREKEACFLRNDQGGDTSL